MESRRVLNSHYDQSSAPHDSDSGRLRNREDSISTSFADRVIARVRELGHPLCVGLDPHLEHIPDLFTSTSKESAGLDMASSVESFCMAVLDRLVGRVAAVKPQSALFEQLGWAGVRALERVAKAARERGLLVVLDAKRSDIGSTAAAYARAALSTDGPIAADAVTVQPYIGLDGLHPFFDLAAKEGKGVFVLVRTSNAGSQDFQGLESAGMTLYEHVAKRLAPLANASMGTSGWSNLGVVAAANYPGDSLKIRQHLPKSLFLVPGFGAQGASALDAVQALLPGPQGILEGGLVNSSREILFPSDRDQISAAAWEKQLDSSLDRAIGELRVACNS